MDAETGDSTQEISFILVPGFAMMSFASGCEAFRAANDLAGRPLHRLRYFGEAEGRVAAASGVEVPTEAPPRLRGQLHICSSARAASRPGGSGPRSTRPCGG